MESFFDLELDYPPTYDPETGIQSSAFTVDDYTMSSAVFWGTQIKSILPIELGMEEESDMKRKRLKSIPSTQQCVYVSVPESSSPLGLTLRKTPSFLDLLDSKLSHPNASFSMLRKIKSNDAEARVPQSHGKTKASNFPASLLQIGSWERVSRYDGELVVKCYFAKRKLVWEVLDGGLKKKIEVQWSDIAALKASCENSAPQTLEIELLKRPLFFRETNPQPRKHTLWKATTDFTDGQASVFRRHFLQFPQGTLQKHFEKLLQLDDRLSLLSKKPFPSLDSAFFSPDNVECQDLNVHKFFGLEEQNSLTSKGFLKLTPSDDYSELLRCFTLTSTTVAQNYSNLDQTFMSSEILSHTLGTNISCLGHETSFSTADIFPSVLVSKPSFIPNFNSMSSSESYSNERRLGEVKTDILGNNFSATSLHNGNLNSKFNINSTLDFKPNYQISEIQTNQKLVDSSKDIGHKSEIDGYLSRLSYVGEVSDNVEDYDNCVEFLANISGNASFPVFIVHDDDTPSSKAVEWNLWM